MGVKTLYCIIIHIISGFFLIGIQRVYIFFVINLVVTTKHVNNKFIRKYDPSKDHKSLRTTERNTDDASLNSGQCFVHQPTILHE